MRVLYVNTIWMNVNLHLASMEFVWTRRMDLDASVNQVREKFKVEISVMENLKFKFFSLGFSGDLCNFEYNECESNPCINGGQCIDHIGGYSCQCTKGYQGNRCHIKVNQIWLVRKWKKNIWNVLLDWFLCKQPMRRRLQMCGPWRWFFMCLSRRS